MTPTLDDKLVVAISSRALFDLEEENRLFESGELEGRIARRATSAFATRTETTAVGSPSTRASVATARCASADRTSAR